MNISKAILFIILFVNCSLYTVSGIEKVHALIDIADLLYSLKHYEQSIKYCEKYLALGEESVLSQKHAKEIINKAQNCLKRNIWYRIWNCPSILPNLLS